MPRRMLIDATHPEETRVVVMNGSLLEDFDFETSTKHQLKGNIYLAKVTRVEPSLQAAFVDYGGNRHGFLPFSEIHPDYFQIPQADRDVLEARERSEATAEPSVEEEVEPTGADPEVANGAPETVSADADEETAEAFDELARRRARLLRSYKIQEVVKRRQIMLVQVVKEERGTKGAALTTYLSCAGRYCVLMPNTPRGGGISRKISQLSDRKRLKEIAGELEVPPGMGLIVRTAGRERTKAEIKRDYDYLLRLWDDIRERTLRSVAPCLIHEEASLIKRAIRDLYTRDIEEVLVEGEDGYRSTRGFMTMLMPSRARHVKLYKETVPLFHEHGVEDQLDKLYTTAVQLRSGGSIVLNPTEALIAIDVNSGRSTRERHIEETALKTNLEAADELARQLRLRDLAGLIVVDFIDMADSRNQRSVERRLRDALKYDRARVQLGKISSFGLLELSRQRLRPSIQELSTQPCPTCSAAGVIRSTESAALQVLRQIEREGLGGEVAALVVQLPTDVALYVLNQKRAMLTRLEARYDMRVRIEVDPAMIAGAFRVERLEMHAPGVSAEERVAAAPPPAADIEAEETAAPEPAAAAADDAAEGDRRRRRRRRRRRPADETDATLAPVPAQDAAEGRPSDEEPSPAPDAEASIEAETEAPQDAAAEATGDQDARRRRRRRRRRGPAEDTLASDRTETAVPTEPEVVQAGADDATEATVVEPARPEEPAPEPARPVEADQVAAPQVPAPNGHADEQIEPAPTPERPVEHRPELFASGGEAGPRGDEDDAPPTEQGGDVPPGDDEQGSQRRGWWSRWVRP